jgi:hypothetical protein
MIKAVHHADILTSLMGLEQGTNVFCEDISDRFVRTKPIDFIRRLPITPGWPDIDHSICADLWEIYPSLLDYQDAEAEGIEYNAQKKNPREVCWNIPDGSDPEEPEVPDYEIPDLPVLPRPRPFNTGTGPSFPGPTPPSGQIDLWRMGTGRAVSAVGGGYSFCATNVISIGVKLGCNFVKSPMQMNWATLVDVGGTNRYFQTAVRSAYYNGIYAVFAYQRNSAGRYYKIFTSTNREDWAERYSVQTSGDSNFLLDGFAATSSGFVAWGPKSGTPENFVIESSDGVNWSSSSIPYSRALRYNPMTDQVSTGAEGDPWMYGYDEPNGIMVGFGNTTVATVFGVTTYARELNTKIYTTTNGTSWSLVYTASVNLTSCAAGGGQMVVTGSGDVGTGEIFYSPDGGTTWGGVDIGNVTWSYTAAISYLNGVFVFYGVYSATDSGGAFDTSVAILKDGVLSVKRPDSYIDPLAP